MTSPHERQWWSGRITQQALPATSPRVTSIVHQSASGSCAFLAEATDGHHYWVKARGNPQGDQTLLTEYVCSKVGQLISAEVVSSRLVQLPEEFDNRNFQDPQGHLMRSGPAYGSLHIRYAWEGYESFREAAPRETLPGLFAMWDLLLGNDEQWLWAPFDQRTVLSFDHSLWLDRGESDWDSHILKRLVDQPWPMDPQPDYLHPESAQPIADNLWHLGSGQILDLLCSVPLEWNVMVEELETLGWFLYRRKDGTARRLEELADG
ncbi:hypothetical protein HGQ17_03810 [Nesterenkonia sp. MY13]|uniref:HipA-like kinase domain-containing protein n=1 Tax=Nesterenkonia sedimenti TaxID=1463632 RepID=A0A7X8YD20_9MICC|nr:HipA family kinase [Nesterenkonia sedimenti]NLS09144.1 hypothetical protein [Nesterenkonia sedimenti]